MLPVPPPSTPADTARFTEHVLETALGPRRYRLFVPGGAGRRGRGSPRALVVVLHGSTQDAADIARGTYFNEHAERQGFIAAYPEQPASANPQKCWNWFDPDHQMRDRGEPAVVAAIAREVMARHRVDPARVHLAGISAGGAMAVIVALAYPQLFASVAVHSGIPYGAASGVQEALTAMRAGGPDPAVGMRTALTAMASHARALPALVLQGAEDPTVRVENNRRTEAGPTPPAPMPPRRWCGSSPSILCARSAPMPLPSFRPFVFPSFPDPIRSWAAWAPDRIALVDRGRDTRLSYAELDRVIARWTDALAGAGVRRGDRIAVLPG